MMEKLKDFFAESVNVALEESIEAFPIEIQQVWNIDLAVTQWREMNTCHIDPEKEILSETGITRKRRFAPISCRQDSAVQCESFCTTQPEHVSGFDHSQNLCLTLPTHIAYF